MEKGRVQGETGQDAGSRAGREITPHNVEFGALGDTLHLTCAGRQRLKRLAAHVAVHDSELDALVGEQKREVIDPLERTAARLAPN